MTLPSHRLLLLHSGALALTLALAAGSVHARPEDLVRINASGVYRVTDDTLVLLDNDTLAPLEALRLARGHRAYVEASSPPDAAGIRVADMIRIETLLRGPMTGIDPPSVLTQTLLVTGDTVFDGLPGLEALAIGDQVEVSGFPDLIAGTVVATRIARMDDPGQDWKLTGAITTATANSLTIGAQAVDISGVTAANCSGPLQPGHFVEIEAVPDPAFAAGATLQGVVSASCEDAAFDEFEPAEGDASIEGIISALADPMPDPLSFELAGVTINATPQTDFRGGTPDDLDEGVRIEAHGQFDANAGVLTATEIRFLQAQVRLIAPADAGAFTGDASVELLGLHFVAAPQVRDEDGLLPDGPLAEVQVELRAFIDANGMLFLTRLRERGTPDVADLRLQGPVTAIANPTLEVLGRTIDTSMAAFRDAAGKLLTREAFFAQLLPGTLVSAEEASIDGVTGALKPALVQLEDGVVPPVLETGIKAMGEGAFSAGTITALGDPAGVFRAGFE